MDKRLPSKLDHFDFFHFKWDELNNTNNIEHRHEICNPLWREIKSEIIENGKFDYVLDLGTGDGRLALQLNDFFSNFIFVDQANSSLNYINNNFLKDHLARVALLNFDLASLDEEKWEIDTDEFNNKIDFVIFGHFFHYLNKKQIIRLLSNVKTLIKDEGHYYLACETEIQQRFPENPNNIKSFLFKNQYNHTIEDLKKIISDLNFILMEEKQFRQPPFNSAIPKSFFELNMKDILGFKDESDEVYCKKPFYIRDYQLIELYFKK